MRQLFASATTTATVLFSLDAVLAVLTWPLVIWMGRPDPDLLFTLSDPRGVLYLAANLITLYAMGLYRRDALMETARSLTRVPLVVGMGAETVVDYALRVKREFGEGTWVMGYADDMISYIPSRRVWNEGGYEGGSNLYEYGRPSFRWAEGIEERIAASVHKLVKQVRE